MDIKALFSELQNSDLLQSILRGEFVLKGNSIIWSFDLSSEDFYDDDFDDNYEDENFSNFESSSTEEKLFDAYYEEIEEIKDFISELDDFEEWTFSEPEIKNDIISFRIFTESN